MKIVDRIQSMSKLALTAEEMAKLSFFIETFDEQCSEWLISAEKDSIESLSGENAAVLPINICEDKNTNKSTTLCSFSFATRFKIKNSKKTV